MLINDKLFMKDNSGFPHCFTISLQNDFFRLLLLQSVVNNREESCFT